MREAAKKAEKDSLTEYAERTRKEYQSEKEAAAAQMLSLAESEASRMEEINAEEQAEKKDLTAKKKSKQEAVKAAVTA